MNIKRIAFEPDEMEQMKERRQRYGELESLIPFVEIDRFPRYGRTEFKGRLLIEEAKSLLAEFDIGLIANHGPMCFGGSCTTRPEGTFYGEYFID